MQYKGLSKDEEEIYNWRFRDLDMMADKYVNVGERSPYNVFRRVFRIFTNTWEHIMLIVIRVPVGKFECSTTRMEIGSLLETANF